MGDTRRHDDDICLNPDWASPAQDDRVTSAVHAVHITDCGWIHPTTGTGGVSAGTPITIAWMCFVYDNQPEGSVTQGRLTQRILERDDTSTGTPMGEHIANTFGYDAFGNVIEIDRTRALGGVAIQLTSVTYDPWANLSGTEAVRRSPWSSRPRRLTLDERVIPGPLGVIATARHKGGTAETLVYVHGDSQANRFFTGGDGTVLQSERFDPYGAIRATTGTPGAIGYTKYLWNGGAAADPFGVDLLGARAYDPSLGRFLQRDPLTLAATASHANPYAFAWSDPVNRADPSGLSPWFSCGWACIGASTNGSSGPTNPDMFALTAAAFATVGIGALIDNMGSHRASPATGVGADSEFSSYRALFAWDPITSAINHPCGFSCGAGIAGDVVGGMYDAGGDVAPWYSARAGKETR